MFANIKKQIMPAITDAGCHKGRDALSSTETAKISLLCSSSFLNINDIASPITMLKEIAPIALAKPISKPNTLAVKIMANTLIAGPE